ncbi:MAG: hypothetical protein WA705_20450 [Candidatus Ozemobacteraceae bacterium]
MFFLEICGEPDWEFVTLSDGSKTKIPVVHVQDLKGKEWDHRLLFQQVLKNSESPLRIQKPFQHFEKGRKWTIRLSPHRLEDWESLRTLPLCVRATLREELHSFYLSCANSLAKLARERKTAKRALPDFFQRIYYPPSKPLPDVASEENFDVGLGLMVPSVVRIAQQSIGRTPNPVKKRYFAFDDPDRPRFTKPCFLIVHPSRDFHDPVTIDRALNARRERFRSRENPVVILYNDDNLFDSLYFVTPGDGELAVFSEDGRHQLFEDCSDVTFAGAFFDWCLGLSIRATISNFFRTHNAGTLTIRLATDGIITETKSPPGTTGTVTAKDELAQLGFQNFVQKRIGQYLYCPPKKDSQIIFPLGTELSNVQRNHLSSTILAEIHGKDKKGRFFPRLENPRFRFRIQQNGKDRIEPIGDPRAHREIIFDILSQ